MPLTTESRAPRESLPERGEELHAIELTDVGVQFRLPADRIVSFKEYVLRRITRGVAYTDLWALRQLSLRVRRGEVFGVIGRNGAGKSTFLKVISRVLRPTTGRVVVRGRVAPLLELGAGFHPDLTGRENVFLNATILRYPRAQIESRFDEIIEFAELQDFVDAPMRTYSTGMLARLGFSVATAFQPDILILDEILAVGDIGFQQKCLERIARFRKEGVTILLVTHDLDTLARHCQRAAWFDRGRIVSIGPPSEIVAPYRNAVLAPAPQASPVSS